MHFAIDIVYRMIIDDFTTDSVTQPGQSTQRNLTRLLHENTNKLYRDLLNHDKIGFPILFATFAKFCCLLFASLPLPFLPPLSAPTPHYSPILTMHSQLSSTTHESTKFSATRLMKPTKFPWLLSVSVFQPSPFSIWNTRCACHWIASASSLEYQNLCFLINSKEVLFLAVKFNSISESGPVETQSLLRMFSDRVGRPPSSRCSSAHRKESPQTERCATAFFAS